MWALVSAPDSQESQNVVVSALLNGWQFGCCEDSQLFVLRQIWRAKVIP
jgi:hypothetical protein